MKKINTFRLVVSMVSAILIFTTNSLSQVLPYIGQTPPGMNPVKFAPNNSYVAGSSWWWRSSPVFSPGGNEMYFVKYFSSTETHEIWYTKCVDGQWTIPQKAPFSTSKFDGNPVFSQSNDTLYFYSQRPGGFIFSVARTATGWSEPVALNIQLPASSAGVTSFYIAKNKTIYFAMMDSSKVNPDIWSSADIYRTEFINGQYNQPENIGAPINTNIGEGIGYVDPEERFLIYESKKLGGYGWHDLYISSRNQNGKWNDPINLGSTINSGEEDGTPQITPDGKYFFYTTIKGRDQGYTPYWVDAKVIYDLIIDTTVVTDYDGNTYKTVKIGKQTWMAENLHSTHYSDGTSIPYFDYNNDTTNSMIYGRLYAWATAMKGAKSSTTNPSNVQGIAPVGWHLPSKAEWQQLADYLGGTAIAGGKIKEVGDVHWLSPNTGSTNESGFTALPAGMYAFWKEFQWKGSYAAFITSTDESVPNHPEVAGIKLSYDNAEMTIGGFHPDDALSVRCIKNAVNTDVNDELSKPTGYNLFQNYPNPFNPSTTIMYSLKTQSHVKLNITNILGEIVFNAIDEIQGVGIHEYQFDAVHLSSGIYFYQLVAGNHRETKKMVLLR
ncbi:MAG: FISUMP domain-containing protein [Ignavibacteria bacterium]|nr:FISUMP domain-containing protein [Ignavibacteria bacterium]